MNNTPSKQDISSLISKSRQKAYYEANKEQIKKQQKAYQEANKEQLKKQRKDYYQTNKQKRKNQDKAYYEANREEIRKKQKNYGKSNSDKIKERSKAHYYANKERANASSKAYYQNNKEKLKIKQKIYNEATKEKRRARITKYAKKRRATDCLYKFFQNVRCQAIRVVKQLSLGKKPAKTFEWVGCTAEELKIHMESLFQEGMTWSNYGKYGWHIDHIRPVCSFLPHEWKEVNHYTNLRPLWAKDNLTKTFFDKQQSVRVSQLIF